MRSRLARISFLLLALVTLLVGYPARAQQPGRVRVPIRDLIPEGLAWDPEEGVFYLSSIHRRGVFRVETTGESSRIGPADDPDALEALGLKIEAERRQLWVCSSGFNAGPNQGRTDISLYELPGGRLIQRFTPPGGARRAMVNDLVLTREGRIYATDTMHGSLQTISGASLVPSLPESTFHGPNGIALSSDERTLFVADGRGVHRLAMESGRPGGMPRLLPLPPGAGTLAGIDGLYAIEGGLIGIQNGRPGAERIVRVRLNAAADSVVAIETLLDGHPLWDIPTTGTFVGGDFWYLANSQLDRIEENGRVAPLDSLRFTEILRLTPTLGLPGSTPGPEPLHVFLLGDAGEPRAGGEPVLAALQAEIARNPARSLAVLLGDNIYPSGLPDSSHEGRSEMERRLKDQLDALRGATLGTVVIPGNHDWVNGDDDGWEAVRRQERLVRRVAAAGAPPLHFVPAGGCPGPVVLDFGPTLRLVALDTQWWLHPGPRPRDPGSDCDCDSEEEVVAALRRAVSDAGARDVVVLGHHPLVSHGPHGGHFTPLDHLFPFRAADSRLWIPLPIIGSLYPISRRAGISRQDMSHGDYERMRGALATALRFDPPLLYASGHDHTLQVLRGDGPRNLVVSGAGILGHTDAVAMKRDTRFAASEAGFFRLDLPGDGSGTLVAFIVEKNGTAREAWRGALR